MSTAELRHSLAAERVPVAVVLAGVVALALAVVADRGVAVAAGLLGFVSILAVGQRARVRWEVLISLVVLVIVFIPIKRYEFSVALPFDLEPYRIVIALVLAVWVIALLADPGVRLRGSVIDGPLFLIGLSVLASLAFNPESVVRFNVVRAFLGADYVRIVRDFEGLPLVDMSGTATKEVLFIASFFLLYYFIVSVVRTPAAIHVVLKTLVLGTTVVALFAILERRTAYNAFDHLQGLVPLLRFDGGLEEEGISRAGRLRVLGPAQHPIALAALFVLVIPPSLYLMHQTRRLLWAATPVLLTLGALATVSRTSIVMLAAVALVFFVLRRDVVKKLAPILLPAIVVVHLALPGAMGGLWQAFFPAEGLVQNQTVFGGRFSEARIGPQIEIIKEKPLLGQGYGTRVTAGDNRNSRILDNEWLGVAVETGFVGVAAWIWLFVRFIRRTGREAKRDDSGRGWLLVALAASGTAFAVGMFTYDAFSFIQASLVFFILLALGASTLAWQGRWPERPEVGIFGDRPRAPA